MVGGLGASGAELVKNRSLRRTSSVGSDDRPATRATNSMTPGNPLLYPATDFVFEPPDTKTKESSVRIPFSQASISCMRAKLLTHDKLFMKFLSSSKDTVAMKTSLQDLFVAYQTAFNSILTGYVQVAEQLTTIDSCQSTIIRACAGITSNCGTTMQSVADKIVRAHPSPMTYADQVKATQKVIVSRGTTVSVPKTTTFIVAPRPDRASDYVDSDSTKKALISAINPAEVNLKVDRFSRTGGNEVRIEARSVDLDKLRASNALAAAGLVVKEDCKFNPRLLVFGIPKDMEKDSIREHFIDQNLGGVENPEVKVVYVFPPFTDSTVTKCVLEVPPDVRTKLLAVSRIYLGFSSCSFKDHVKVKQCYRCLAFGHLAKDCTGITRCGFCAGEHERKNCPDGDKEACCYNCKLNNFADTNHAAVDGSKCPILKRRLTNKVHLTNYGEL